MRVARRRAVAVAFATVTIVLVVLAIAGAVDPLQQGLTVTYFSDRAWTSTPILSQIDRQPSTDSIMEAWGGGPPASFSATWAGSLFVPRGGAYTFATASDDGSWVYVDGQLVVDNGGGHATTLKQATVRLDRGVHSLFVKYFQ
jgi:hypothetical protein